MARLVGKERRIARAALAMLVFILPLVACSGGPERPAPVIYGGVEGGAAAQPAEAAEPAPAEITVRPGQSLYAIAAAYRVSPRVLIVANKLQPPYVLQPGWTLIIPGRGFTAPPETVSVARLRSPGPVPPYLSAPIRRPLYPPEETHLLTARPPKKPRYEAHVLRLPSREIASNPPRGGVLGLPSRKDAKLAAATPAPIRRQRQAAASAGRNFLWPVRGRILENFGKGPEGTHNDGINIAAPTGAPIEATAGGIVVYTGNELRGYGNLILIKHADEWISAYAHCQRILVRRGEHVRRGQIIARVGATGNVKVPQLHFEIRRGDEPVDPLQLLAPLSAAALHQDARRG